jgi:hypothetical protein
MRIVVVCREQPVRGTGIPHSSLPCYDERRVEVDDSFNNYFPQQLGNCFGCLFVVGVERWGVVLLFRMACGGWYSMVVLLLTLAACVAAPPSPSSVFSCGK